MNIWWVYRIWHADLLLGGLHQDRIWSSFKRSVVLQEVLCNCSRTSVIISEGWQLDVGYFCNTVLRALCSVCLHKQTLKRLFQPGLLCAWAGMVTCQNNQGQLLTCRCVSPQMLNARDTFFVQNWAQSMHVCWNQQRPIKIMCMLQNHHWFWFADAVRSDLSCQGDRRCDARGGFSHGHRQDALGQAPQPT